MSIRWASLGCFFLAASLEATPPPAGIVERELQKEFEGEPLSPHKDVPAVQIDIPVGLKVLVEGVEFQGNDSLSRRELEHEVSGFLHRELSMQEIYALCKQIDQYYAKRGYFLARAYPPPQQIHQGILQVEVIEGRAIA